MSGGKAYPANQFKQFAAPAPVAVNTAPLYKALEASRLAMLAMPRSGASIVALSQIDAILNAAPAPALHGCTYPNCAGEPMDDGRGCCACPIGAPALPAKDQP